MATTVHAHRPQRDISWLLGESTPVALGIAAVGGLSLALTTVGVVIVLAAHGFTPTNNLILGFRSNEMTGVTLWGLVVGVVALVAGLIAFRRMPTKVSREEAIAGAVLGAQGALIGGLLLRFSESPDTFISAYLDFRSIQPEIDAFVRAAWNTIKLAVISEFFGVILGLILSIFAVSKRAVVRAPARAYINFFRGTPLVWQLIMFGIGIPIGLGINIGSYQAGLLAFSLNTAAYAAEVFRAGIQSIEKGQLEAARGLGMSQMQALRYAVIPQAIRRVVPPLMNEFVILIKDTSLLIVLGLTAAERELMAEGLFLQNNTFNPSFLVATALGYLAVSLPSIRLVNILERRLRSGLVGVTA